MSVYTSSKILASREIDLLWATVKSADSKSDNRRGNIPMIKTTIDSTLLSKYEFDVAKCYSLYTKKLNYKEKVHLFTIARIKNLIQDIKNFYYIPECYDYWDMGYSDYCFSNATNKAASTKENYIINTFNAKITSLMSEEKWDICVNQIIITLHALKSEKTTSFHVMRKFAIIIAPFLPYTAEEVWQTLIGKSKKSIFCENYPIADNWFTRRDYTKYKVFINDDTEFTYDTYNFLDDTMTKDTFANSISLTNHLDGRVATKIKFIKDKYIIVNAE